MRLLLSGLFIVFLANSLLGGLSTSLALPNHAQSVISGKLSELEIRFLHRTYSHDLLEKRLERLELLLFGSAQEGNQQERLKRLLNVVTAQHLDQNRQINNGMSSTNHKTFVSALDKLETEVFKRNHPKEQISKRLAALETKVFGRPNPAMTHASRIERLERAVGLGSPQISQNRGLEGNLPLNGFSLMTPFPAFDFRMQPFGGSPIPESMSPDTVQMLRELNKLLQSRQMLPRQYPGNPRSDDFIQIPHNGNKLRQVPQTQLPSYYDPNSI